MLILISPSKSQDFETPAPIRSDRLPPLLADSQLLVELLRRLPVSGIRELMQVSEKIAQLNHARYAAWHLPMAPEAARPAAHAFKGDVYDGLDFASLNASDVDYAERHLRILSGLYALLTPLTQILPYRLEMGIPLINPRGRNLYEFWGDRITELLNRDLAEQADGLVVNLASNEYFSAVRPRRLAGRIVTPVFKDRAKSGELKIISFFAKRARGMMSRWIIQNRIRSAEALQAFDVAGYSFQEAESGPDTLVFSR